MEPVPEYRDSQILRRAGDADCRAAILQKKMFSMKWQTLVDDEQ